MAQSFSIGVMVYINGFMDVTFSHNDLIGRQQVDFQVHVYSYMAIESTSITAMIPTKFCSVLKTMSLVAQWGQSRLSMISFCSAICIVIDYFTKMSFTPVFSHSFSKCIPSHWFLHDSGWQHSVILYRMSMFRMFLISDNYEYVTKP